jgi:hypothetical protein
MNPEHHADYDEIDRAGDISRPVSLRPVFSGEYFKSVVAYPVIVERWDKAKSDSKQRRYRADFTEAERKLIASYYSKFYRWYLVTGTPDKVMVKLDTINLLQRAVNFFASI